MMSTKSNFLAAYWHLLLLGVGVVATGFFAFVYFSPQEEVENFELGVANTTPVAATDFLSLQQVTNGYVNAAKVVMPASTKASFLASGPRVYCGSGLEAGAGCGRPIPPGAIKCPFCGINQAKEVKVVLDTNNDGFTDAWEMEHNLPVASDHSQLDSDNDGFTNLEEKEAGTDIFNDKSHPEYLDYMKLVLPLQETLLPFYFSRYSETPVGARAFFLSPRKRNDYGQMGAEHSVLPGEEIGKTGYKYLSFEKKSEKRQIKGSEQGMFKEVDISEVKIQRLKDKRELTLVLGVKRNALDAQARLVYSRDGGKEFMVIAGSEFELRGETYRVRGIKTRGNGVEVEIQSIKSARRRTLRALEQ